MNADLNIDELKEAFEQTGNPVFVWYAILNTASHNAPQPVWVRDYLHSMALKMVDLFWSHPHRNEAEAVGKAFGFGGSGKGQNGKFAEIHKFDRDLLFYNSVVGEIARASKTKPTTLEWIYEHVAKETLNVSAASVRRAHLRFTKLKHDANQLNTSEKP